MKKLARRFLNHILSLVTTFLLMAAPVAAIVYASEPIEVNHEYTAQKSPVYAANAVDTPLELVADKINDWKPDILDDSIASTFMNLKQNQINEKEVHERGVTP